MATPRRTKPENFRAEIDVKDGGQVIIEPSVPGRMRIVTTSSDDGKGNWVTLTAREVLQLKGAITAFEHEAIRNRW